ncbi:MOSC domain-containing protein [Marinobacter sp. C2H3]|uniref:MOSC domain-containing protein n=1 Tax=Marinobacter sp. C2H3 TaxID=3119003 RepID=UPI00300EE713
MHVQALYLYPVKSLAGLPADQMTLDEFGPAGDRRWMIVDASNRFVTQRERPELALVTAGLEDGRVTITVPDAGVHLLEPIGNAVTVEVWRDTVMAIPGPASANQALSDYLKHPVRLVYMPDSSFRQIDPSRVPERRRVGFADGFPFLVTNQASLEDLNQRLEQIVSMRRFRPNIVVAGAEPWEEDHWRALAIGDHELSLVKPCSRCVMTTVDPYTGIKHAGAQPLRTLAGYRKTEDGVIFGMNAVHDRPGTLRIGDAVRVITSETR